MCEMALRNLLLLVFSVFVRIHAGEYVQVTVGDPFTLCRSCKIEEGCRLQRVQVRGISEVAVHRAGVWRAAQPYRSRMSESSPVSFHSAAYTDSGVYELSCGGQVVTIQLDVVVSFNVSVREGEAVSLPCYSSAAGLACWSVSWVKDGRTALEQDSCADESAGFADGRLSMSPERLLLGDASLYLQQARREDEGDYFCYIQGRGSLKERGNPAAVRLRVSERSPDRTTSSPPCVSQPAEVPEETSILAPVAFTAVICLIVGLVGGWLLTLPRLCFMWT